MNSEEDLLNFNRNDRWKSAAVWANRWLPPATLIISMKKTTVSRNIIMAAHGFKELDEEPSLYLKTTDEMLAGIRLSG